MSSHHLSLSLSRELWEELLGAALPVKLAGERFSVTHDLKRGIKSLGVRQRVAGLLEQREAPQALLAVRDRARRVWHDRRSGVYRRVNDLVRIEGTWKVELDNLGSQLTYGHQRVGADAFVRGVGEGTIYLLRENVELPFRIERRLGASVALGDIRYDPGHEAVIGTLQDLGVYIGDNAVLQLLARLAEYGLEQQLPRVNPLPILKREQVQEMVGPMGGALKMQMGVQDLELEINDDDLVLKVRFGFTRKALPDHEAEPEPLP
jgi:hypothetical protein